MKTKFNKKEYMKNYNKTYYSTPEAKQAQKKWHQSPEGKAKFRAAQHNYYFKYCGIYGAIDTQTKNWLYIGASKSVNGRIINHRYATKNLSKAKVHRPTQYELYVNLSQHQVEWKIICECDPTKLKSVEKHYLTMYKPPYNKYSKTNTTK